MFAIEAEKSRTGLMKIRFCSLLLPAGSAGRTSHQCIAFGDVPEKDNTVFARLMDAGKLLIARITKIEKRRNFTQISIGIFLVDF